MWLSFEITTRVVVGGFLLLAGMAKLSAGPAWRRSWLRAFRLAPPPLMGAIALGVSVAELSAGAALLAGAGGSAGAAVAAGLLGLVTAHGATASRSPARHQAPSANQTAKPGRRGPQARQSLTAAHKEGRRPPLAEREPSS